MRSFRWICILTAAALLTATCSEAAAKKKAKGKAKTARQVGTYTVAGQLLVSNNLLYLAPAKGQFKASNIWSVDICKIPQSVIDAPARPAAKAVAPKPAATKKVAAKQTAKKKTAQKKGPAWPHKVPMAVMAKHIGAKVKLTFSGGKTAKDGNQLKFDIDKVLKLDVVKPATPEERAAAIL